MNQKAHLMRASFGFLSKHLRWIIPVLWLEPGVAQTISPPSVQVIDKFNVNMLNGQVNAGLATVSIGGENGLAHSITMYTNHFFPLRGRGYQDKFYSISRYTQQIEQDNSVRATYRVFDFDDSVDFQPMVNGQPHNGSGSVSTNYSYRAIRDERHRLEVAGPNGEFLDWTKPDGTICRFTRPAGNTIGAEGRLRWIFYPNGFTLDIDLPYRVSTNTGYSLMYLHETDSRPLPPNVGYPMQAPGFDPGGWANANPRHVKAVNNAVCSTNSASCLARSWPTATFTWPAGMPRVMYANENVFSVETPAGTTSYRFKAYDLAYNEGGLVQGYTPGDKSSPRLIKIKPAGSTNESIEYAYKNLFSIITVGLRDDMVYAQGPPGTFPTSMGSYELLIQEAGGLVSSKVIDSGTIYGIGEAYQGAGSAQNRGSVTGGVWRVILHTFMSPATISMVNMTDRQVNYEASARNWPMSVMHNSGITEGYEYTRGNVSRVTRNGATVTRAEYPPESACATNRKTCNLPTSEFDGKDFETKFQYHPDSGQLARVTPPADQNGRIAEKRIDYAQKRARYYDANGVRVDGSPIWLKTAERRCFDSNYASADPTAGCVGNDEIVTRYEYNHDNLLLTSTTITDPLTNKTLRTCFQYDARGNKIGETQPKGAASCN